MPEFMLVFPRQPECGMPDVCVCVGGLGKGGEQLSGGTIYPEMTHTMLCLCSGWG